MSKEKWLRIPKLKTRGKEKKKTTTGSELRVDEIKELIGKQAGREADKGLQRMEAYIERPVQRLLRSLLEAGPKAEILPEYDASHGFRYKDVESVLGEDTGFEKSEAFLEKLAELGILRRSFYDSITACPSCSSTHLTSHFRCPRCGSHQINRSGLIEHIPCGNIDDRDKFYKGYVQPTCPKCGQLLEKSNYRDMGLWYRCKSCGERFEHPELDLICRICGNKFETQAIQVKEISKYSINLDLEQEILQNVTSLESLNKILTDIGFLVEESASVIGDKSGIQHKFSILAKRRFNGRELVVSVDHAVASEEVTASPLILYTYKLSEVKVDLPIFVAIPRLSEVGRRIANGYGIFVIEGVPRDSADLTKIQEELKVKLKEKLSAEETLEAERILPKEDEEILQRILKDGTKIEVVRDKSGKFKKVQKTTES